VAKTQQPARPKREPTGGHIAGTGLSTILPRASINLLAGLMEAVAAAPYQGKADLPAIAGLLQMEADELFPIAEVLQLMRFAEVGAGDIRFTETAFRERRNRRAEEAVR